MNRRSVLLAALVATTTAFATPAAHAEDAQGNGLTCGLYGTRDGQTHYDVTVTGGPFVTDDRTAFVSIACTVKVVRAPGWEETVARAETAPAQGVAVLDPRSLVFDAAYTPGTNLEVCTEVTVYTDGQQPQVHHYDADGDPSNGAQCAPASSPPDDGQVEVFFVPPNPWYEQCVVVYPGVGPIQEPVGECP